MEVSTLTLKEIAKDYEAAAVPLRKRLQELRQALKATDDPDEIWHLKRRSYELSRMLTECKALADICEHYYEPGFYCNEAYTFHKSCRTRELVKADRSADQLYDSSDYLDDKLENLCSD